MEELNKVKCPVCHHILWINQNNDVIKHEKSRVKKDISLDKLIIKEKEKKEKFDETFLSAKQLERRKKKEAEEIFKNAFKENKNQKE